MVQDVFHHSNTHRVHRTSPCRMEEVFPNCRMRGFARPTLDAVLLFHQGKQRVDRRGMFCPRRLLHRHLRTDNIQEEDFVDRATALTHHRSRTTLHLLVRLPLSLRYHHWRGIVSCMCALRHIQQEGERRCKVAHYAYVSDEWRHCGREHHHSFLPDDFPFQSARSGNS